jgi:activator of 2-hydroxyglutaryl-CoA dehydratase
MAGRLGLQDEVVFTGGVARNAGVVWALQEVLGKRVHVPRDPEYTGAFGAALLAGGEDMEGHRDTEAQRLGWFASPEDGSR